MQEPAINAMGKGGQKMMATLNAKATANYNAYDELMQYFGFEFIVQVALAIIVLIVFLKTMLRAYTVMFKVKLNQKIPLEAAPLEWIQSSFDILVSAIGVMGLISAMIFQGVMSDIPLESGHIWADKTLIIFIMALSMFVLQVVATIYVSLQKRECSRGKIKQSLFIALISCIFIFVIIYSLPKAVELEIKAVQFSMIESVVDKDGASPVVVKLRGYKRNGILSASSYWGQLIIDDRTYVVDQILLDRYTNCVVIDKESGEAFSLGTLFLNKDLSKITLNVINQNKWHTKDGTVIAGPAKDVTESVAIANDFYRQNEMFKGTVLKFKDQIDGDDPNKDESSKSDVLDEYTYVGTFSNGQDIYIEFYRYNMQEAAWTMVLVENGVIIKTFKGTSSKPKFSKDRNQILYIDELQFETVGNVVLYDVRTDKIEMLTDFQYGTAKMETVKDVEWYGDAGHMLCIVGMAFGTVSEGGQLYDLDPVTKVMQKIDLSDVAAQWTKRPYEIVDIALSEESVDLTLIEWTDDNYMYYRYTVHTLTFDELSELLK